MWSNNDQPSSEGKRTMFKGVPYPEAPRFLTACDHDHEAVKEVAEIRANKGRMRELLLLRCVTLSQNGSDEHGFFLSQCCACHLAQITTNEPK